MFRNKTERPGWVGNWGEIGAASTLVGVQGHVCSLSNHRPPLGAKICSAMIGRHLQCNLFGTEQKGAAMAPDEEPAAATSNDDETAPGAARRTARRALKRRDGTPLRCLIVEDEWLIALDLRHSVEALGAVVVGMVMSGAAAIDLAERQRPDVVLMDISIRGDIDGIEAARVILTRFAIPVVFISSFSDAQIRSRIAALNGPELLIKPAHETTIEAAIRRACSLPPSEA